MGGNGGRHVGFSWSDRDAGESGEGENGVCTPKSVS